MNRPRPSSDPTHYSSYLNGDKGSDARNGSNRRSSLEQPKAEDQPSRGRLVPRTNTNRHSDPVGRERLEAHDARRNSIQAQRPNSVSSREDTRQNAVREDALARLCGFASAAEANQPPPPSSLPESARRHFMMRSASDRHSNPQYANLREVDETPEREKERDKRVTFDSRDMYYEFIKGERPMRDPKEEGASQPSHRNSAPPVLSNLRASRELDPKIKGNANRDRHSAPPVARRDYKKNYQSYQEPPKKNSQAETDNARSTGSSSRSFLETPEAKAYRKACPEAYIPVNVYDPSFVSPEKKQEEEEEEKRKAQTMPQYDPTMMPPFMMQGMNPAMMQAMNPMMMQGFYGFPYGAKDRKPGNAFTRFKDRLVDLTCEPGFPEVPSAQELAEQTSIPRDENGDPKLPWEKSSKCRIHDPRKYVIKKNLPNQPTYVSELKAIQREEERRMAERIARIQEKDAARPQRRFSLFSSKKKPAEKRNSNHPAQARPRSASVAI